MSEIDIRKKAPKPSLNHSKSGNSEPLIVIKREVLSKAYQDPVFGERLEKAQTYKEMASILKQFCEQNGYKTKEVAIP